MDSRERACLLKMRQGLIIVLGGLEEYLGLPRTIVPKHERERTAYTVPPRYPQDKVDT